jgi:hypothetical protein
MNRMPIFPLCALSVIAASSAAIGDTLTLTPKVQAREQVCFLGTMQGYVSDFDGKEFNVYVLVRGCGGRKTLPVECTPYVVPNGGLPKELASAVDSATLALAYKFKTGELQMIVFDQKVDSSCSEHSIKPNSLQRLPDTVWVAPTKVVTPAIVGPAALSSAGLEGKFVGVDWSESIKDKDPVKVKDDWLIAWPRHAGGPAIKTNEKIAVGGMLGSSEGAVGYYFVGGVVKDVKPNGIVMTVNKIVETKPGLPPKFVEIRMPGIGAVNIAPVTARVQPSPKKGFGWLGKLRDLEDELYLDVQSLHSNGGRTIEVRASGAYDAPHEILWLMRADQ